MSSLITTHILDTARGRGASGVAVQLHGRRGDGWEEIAYGVTDENGRISQLGPDVLPAGLYRLTFDTGAYFDEQSTETFFPEVALTFNVAAGELHYHVPLLLSPFAYSTYRGN
ncbi:hydroxyisourate hydrolase [Homoserinimonas sp. OAct 916]|uniref:hydroxyisourate hydrolase n=1 Tax=Homoserinimonas sp. OAct 916 TaxID=2211450 RepID=UPI000DBE55E4|nr:hydroxyisourate hydrolase [Homoserinimonas sp. OAct 916]